MFSELDGHFYFLIFYVQFVSTGFLSAFATDVLITAV